MRIDKLLSECGLCSRKEAALFAKKGKITVNGIPEKRSDRHIDPENDRVALSGQPVCYRTCTYVMLNKPEGYISATEDGRFPVVTELLPESLQRIGLFPCGRLDKDTVGLMILTNDGPLSHRLLSPRHHVEKTYAFTCESPLHPEAEKIFLSGMTIGNACCKPAVLCPDPDRTSGTVILTEGKYHQIKRMFQALGNRITFLQRTAFGGIALDPGLSPGEWRYLTEDEIAQLQKYQ